MSPIKSIDQLTSLRFFAAAAIMFLHSKPVFLATRSIESPIPLDFAVSFFFVLSGFILTYNYRDLRTKNQVLEYYGSRVSRVWPVHLFSFVLVLVLIPQPLWTASVPDQHISIVTALNLLLLHAWVPISGYFFSYNGVSWSISTELFFYLVFPFLIRDWSRTWHYKSLFVFGAAFGLVGAAQLLKLPVSNGESPLMVSSTGIAYISPLVRITEFLVGMWTAKIFLSLRYAVVRPTVGWTLVEIGAIAAIYLIGTLCMNMIRSSSSLDALQIYMGSSGGALAFALAILALAHGNGWISKVLAIKPLVLLGQASFALYMTHQIAIKFIYINGSEYFAEVPDNLLLWTYWIGCIAFSIGIYRWVEQPFRSRLRALLRPRRLRDMNARPTA